MSDLTPFESRIDAVIERSENMLSICRDRQLQIETRGELQSVLGEISVEKSAAVAKGNEAYANSLLGFQCVCAALVAEIQMWILLKEERPDDAWDELVNAQMATIDSTRAHSRFAHLSRHYRRLEVIERLIFPPQVFLSSGFVVESQECAICRTEYGDCDHLVGKPYMGEICSIVAREIQLDHVAIVSNPADKRCRIRVFGVEGGERNRMTWKISPK